MTTQALLLFYGIYYYAMKSNNSSTCLFFFTSFSYFYSMPNACRENNAEALWMLFKEGDVHAFEAIIKNHYQNLYNYGTRFCRDSELIKDSLQELFLLLWKNRENLGTPASVKNYLLKSLRRKLFREASKTKQANPFDELYFDAGFNMVLPVEHNVILQEKLTELSFKVRSVLEKLSPRQQEIIYLRFYMDADVDEISEIMELSRQSVYNLLHEALKRFKALSSLDYFSLSLSLMLFFNYYLF